MGFQQVFNREQLIVFDFELMLSTDSWARVVDVLPLKELGFNDILADEVNLMMMCYNLRRIMSIFGINTLKKRLKDFVFYFLAYIEGFLTVLSDFFIKLQNYST